MNIVIVNSIYWINRNFLKKVSLIGDSKLKHLYGYGLSKLTNHRFNVKSRFHPGIKINDHIKPIFWGLEADKMIIHIGKNYLPFDKSLMQICNGIISLVTSIHGDNINLVISLIVRRNDNLTHSFPSTLSLLPGNIRKP